MGVTKFEKDFLDVLVGGSFKKYFIIGEFGGKRG